MKNKILIVLGLLFMFVVSCGGKHPAVKDFEESMKILQSGNLTENLKAQNKTLDPTALQSMGEGYKKMTYKINKTTVKGDEAIINVTMKAPNLAGLMEEYIQKAMTNAANFQNKPLDDIQKESEKMFGDMVKQKLADSNLKYNEKTFDVVYKKSGDKWYIDPNGNSEYIEMVTLGMLNVKQ